MGGFLLAWDRMGFDGVLAMLLALAGLALGARSLLRLVTGGPRNRVENSSPRLYDRAYYVMDLVLVIAWTGLAALFVVAKFTFDISDLAFAMFLAAFIWAMMGIKRLARSEMMAEATRYYRSFGSFRERMIHRFQPDYPYEIPRKIFAGLLLLIAVAGLVIGTRSVPRAISLVPGRVVEVIQMLTASTDGRVSPLT